MIFKRKYFMVFDLGSLCYGAFTAIKILSISCIIINSTSYCAAPSMSSLGIDNELEGAPEGYYAFVESPKMEPPQVKLPPYIRLNRPCTSIGKRISSPNANKKSLNNLCGDLNKGAIPANPMNQNIYGTPYPFELIKNKTLEFFSRTLPILKADETIPKVATLQAEPQYYLYQQPSNAKLHQRIKRSGSSNSSDTIEKKQDTNSQTSSSNDNVTRRQSRKFCDNDQGIWCILYKLIQSQVFRSVNAQKRQDAPHLEYRTSADAASTQNPMPADGPATPCPARVEYATPVFARNHQGIWRYVVQIPYEGYFTQTIEVIKCTNQKCFYMEGGCLSSPRWVSLLVAEIYYPETITPINRRPPVHRSPVMSDDPPPIDDFRNYQQQYLHKRAVPSSSETKSSSNTRKVHCDGVDELGCFQVRLYYDWFLVPGSCKCWRPDYFQKYMRYGRDISYEL
ncbi:uncharacterized protein spz6 [Planococcus citri]|uniref:uncharacterized protein spz6 n=1 Tax=Planococcus citri TaxID=170843 RepID=UPI0031F878E2